MGFGLDIKRLREEVPISAQRLADKIGIDADRLRKWEQKDLTPRLEDVQKIESFFGMELSALQKLKSIKNFLKVPHETRAQEVPAGVGRKTGTDEKYLALMEERIRELKEDKEWLKQTIDSSLGSLFYGQRNLLAHVQIGLERDEAKESSGSPKKASQLLESRNRRISELMAGQLDTDKIDGKHGKRDKIS
ncbi:MAG TPA: helix-turn-helix transcriptional regulator [Flavobacterium sp.]|nr:helix-turn-helix transcriptional regulator [Flavobacterium sp.]